MQPQSPYQPEPQKPQPVQPQQYPQQPVLIDESQNGPHPANYDFIMNTGSDKRPSSPLPLPTGNSTVARAAIFGGGIVVLLIVILVFKSILLGGSDLSTFVTVVKDQQELIHLASNAHDQDELSKTNANAAATMQLALQSSQSDLLSYLGDNKKKVTTKDLDFAIKPDLDEQLKTAADAGTYNQTFQKIMQDELNTYSIHLQAAYKAAPGKRSQTLLSGDYDQAKLLYNQISATPAADD